MDHLRCKAVQQMQQGMRWSIGRRISGGGGGGGGVVVGLPALGGLPSLQAVRASLPRHVLELVDGKFESLINIGVAWGEQDAFGHVNNVSYMRYFESARIQYFDQIVGGRLTAKEYEDFITGRGVGPILKSASIKYLAPVTYPDTLTLGTVVRGVERDRFVQRFEGFSHRLGRKVVEGEATIVTFDYRINRKADIPAGVLAAFNAARAAAAAVSDSTTSHGKSN